MITRREFVRGVAAAGALAYGPGLLAAEPPLETTRLRLIHDPSICVTPQYLAEELLRADGFTDVRYIDATDGSGAKVLASGDADIMMEFAFAFVSRIDAGDPIVVLGGVHVGCAVLFGGPQVRTIRDLKGKQVAVLGMGAPDHVFLSSVAAYVGLDPPRDIRWMTRTAQEAIRLLAEDKIDAFMAFPPAPQELRDRKIGHVVLNTTTDRPWSNYFCCMVGANRDFARKHPVATKRALRAILKGADLCAGDPERAARFIVQRGYTGRLDYASQTIREIPYTRWREFDAEDTMRFYALRLKEGGFIKSDPAKIIARGTDWRFLNELKRELKV